MSLKVTVQIGRTAPEKSLYWIPHDRFRYSYDDRSRQHSHGWKYNPSGTGLAREVTRDTGMSMPEVYRFQPDQSIIVTDRYKDLLCAVNPMLSREKAISLLDRGVAWCNITDGVFDQARICGGALVEGREINGRVYIKTMLLDDPVPTALYAVDNYLTYIATGVQPDGDINLIHRRGEDGELHPVRMIMLTVMPIYAPVDEVLRLPPGFTPPPQWMPVV